jgi:hypothetical protein
MSVYHVRFVAVVAVALSGLSVRGLGQAPPSADRVMVSPEMLETALDLPCPKVSLGPDSDRPGSDLADYIDILSQLMTEAAGFRVYILPDHTELELDGIPDLHDVEMRPLAVADGTHTFRDVLAMVVQHTRPIEPELVFLPSGRRILLTTFNAAWLGMQTDTRVYDVGDLLKPIRDAGHFERKRNMLGTASWSASGVLSQTLCDQTLPARWPWMEGENGVISSYGDSIVINQHYFVHRRIEQVLDVLRHPESLASAHAEIPLQQDNRSKLVTREKIERVWNLRASSFQSSLRDGDPVKADEFLGLMEQQMSEAAGFPVKIRIDWHELERLGVKNLSNIRMLPPPDAKSPGTYGEILEFAAQHCSGSDVEVAIVPRGRDIFFSTRVSVEYMENFEVLGYDVKTLLEKLATVNGRKLNSLLGIMGSEDEVGVDPNIGAKAFLYQVILDHGSPGAQWYERDGDGGWISICGTVLLIKQSCATQMDVRRFLQQLSAVAAGE